MKRLYLFNPENDLALAADMPHFTPPTAALKLKRAACMLPMWYGEDGDYVLVDVDCVQACEAIADNNGIRVKFVTEVPGDVADVSPWGWSRHARQQLLARGCPESLLPSDRELEDIRELSHRRLTVQIYEELGKFGMPYPLAPIPREVSDINYIASELEAGRHKFIKSPWSGSGRGVIDTLTAPPHQVLRLAEGVIRRQGSVMIEERLDKVCDFAMLFEVNNGEARFVGYSVFFNESYSTYSGNVLADNDQLEAMIARYVDAQQLRDTQSALVKVLTSEIGGRYNGPLGIDMMIYREGDEYRIAQCVEVNLRMTMGRVAYELAAGHLPAGHRGIMKIVSARDINAETNSKISFLTPREGNDFAFVMMSELK